MEFATMQIVGVANETKTLIGVGDDDCKVSPINSSVHKCGENSIPPRNLLCSREEIRNGSWIPTILPAPPYVTRTTHLRCYSMEAYKNGSWNTFTWQPRASPNCKFTAWKRGKFCALMKRATILVAGDSLSWEHYSSLAQLLGQKVSQFDQHRSKVDQRNHVQYPCKGETRIAYRRDDILSNLTGAITETFPQVLILNRGAHYVNDTRFVAGLRQNVEEIKKWKHKCDMLGVACHLFWRTSVPGHPKCDQVDFSGPVNDLDEMEAWIANKSNYDNRTINYHWYDYQHQNELAVNMLQESLGFEHDILDAYHLNVRRPDEHRSHQNDCLHNCYPGKMDVYNQLLLHFLKIRRDRDDVSILVDLFDKHDNE